MALWTTIGLLVHGAGCTFVFTNITKWATQNVRCGQNVRRGRVGGTMGEMVGGRKATESWSSINATLGAYPWFLLGYWGHTAVRASIASVVPKSTTVARTMSTVPSSFVISVIVTALCSRPWSKRTLRTSKNTITGSTIILLAEFLQVFEAWCIEKTYKKFFECKEQKLNWQWSVGHCKKSLSKTDKSPMFMPFAISSLQVVVTPSWWAFTILACKTWQIYFTSHELQ